MKQDLKVVARTVEVQDGIGKEALKNVLDEFNLLSGKAAGTCYMPDDYFEKGVQNTEAAKKRAFNTANSGHYSVFEHPHITLMLKTNKMMAMILNSLGVYVTSEKSARYTKMQPETELEQKMYDKWKLKLKQLILERYPDIDDEALNSLWKKKYPQKTHITIQNGKIEYNTTRSDTLDIIKDEDAIEDFKNVRELTEHKGTLPSSKLAQENARYMISVFTPTTMLYTISWGQTMLITEYLFALAENCTLAKDSFSKKLYAYVHEMYELFSDLIKDSDIQLSNIKNQYIRFLEAQHIGGMWEENSKNLVKYTPETLETMLRAKQENLSDSYTLVYEGSLAMLAQAQRHRTLRYTMKLQEATSFYTPKVLEKQSDIDEWQNDIKSVAYCIPQGTIVRITEQGLFEDFVLKCKERLCGRAQLEITLRTVESVKKFATVNCKLCNSNMRLLESITVPYEEGKGFKPCARCQFKDFICKEGCKWGALQALTRLV